MHDVALRVYWRLPFALRSLVASARGWQLRRWRYGAETEELVAQALERERWSPAQWQAWREERLAFVLHRAATRVPYYRDLWSARRRRGDRASWEVLAHWPTLEKEAVRHRPEAFLADDCRPERMFEDHTSGSTGTPLRLWQSRATVRQWYALFEARWRRWYGVSRHDRWAILGGQMVAPVWRQRAPFWVWNAALHQLYVSVYHLSPRLIPDALAALRRHGITHVLGYPSALDALARSPVSDRRRIETLKVAIANAEPVYRHQRARIASGLRCPVRETYGMAEAVAAAGECEAGRLHLWPEAGIIELFDGDAGRPGAAVGDLVATGLLNPDMPLIRYRTGDRATRATDQPCPCGRTLPVLRRIEGRRDDAIVTPDGRWVGRLDPVFKGGLPIREAQIVQEEIDRIRVPYVPAPGFAPRHARQIETRLRARLGRVTVILEECDHIPRGAGGKLRGVVSLVHRRRAYATGGAAVPRQ
jgi:phenylacetate-CoA ligase